MMMTSGHAVRRHNRGRTHAMIVTRRHCHGSRQRGERTRQQHQQHQFGDQTMHTWIGKGIAWLGEFPTSQSPSKIRHRNVPGSSN